ncbi:proteophosphoglycan ppg4 [Rhodotorula toruloides]|uniref:Proteophosphoglycan ppg4 n=1 Tax=Rhodotorula toruloides TaxID=5286 RepID=A0A511KKR6_RHOTO|nr:proteophosphoglycan ppg4 [Rhodotorula toruloides]
MTARWDLLPDGEEGVKLVRKCAITSVTEPLQSVHVLAARREKLASGKWVSKGQAEIKFLSSARVIPKNAHVHSQANRLELATAVHSDLEARLLHLVPDRQPCVARLLCEVKYQEERLAILAMEEAPVVGEKRQRIEVPPARPSFNAFYKTLEASGACYRVTGDFRRTDGALRRVDDAGLDILAYRIEGIDENDARRQGIAFRRDVPASRPVFPPVITPLSTNLLIWAMVDRVEQGYPDDLCEETSELQCLLRCLIRFWRLTDDVESFTLRKLVDRAHKLIEQDATWAAASKDLASVSFDSIAGLIKLPDSAVSSQVLPTETQRARIRATMEDDHDDLPELNFLREEVPSDSVVPLTTSALEFLQDLPLPAPSPIEISDACAGADPQVGFEGAHSSTTPSLSHDSSDSARPSTSIAPSLPPKPPAPLEWRGFPPGKAKHMSSWLEQGPYTEPQLDSVPATTAPT